MNPQKRKKERPNKELDILLERWRWEKSERDERRKKEQEQFKRNYEEFYGEKVDLQKAFEEYYGEKIKGGVIKEEEEQETSPEGVTRLPSLRIRKKDPKKEIVQGIFADSTLEEEEKEERIIKIIGPPPYTPEEVEEYNLPERFFTRKRRNILPAKYAAENPHPNYNKFHPDMIDSDGREYSIHPLTTRHEIFQPKDKNNLENASELPSGTKIPKEVLFVRIPIRLAHVVDFPEPDSSLTLFQKGLEFQFNCKIEECFMKTLRATGYIEVRNGVILKGKSINQALYNKITSS